MAAAQSSETGWQRAGLQNEIKSGILPGGSVFPFPKSFRAQGNFSLIHSAVLLGLVSDSCLIFASERISCQFSSSRVHGADISLGQSTSRTTALCSASHH